MPLSKLTPRIKFVTLLALLVAVVSFNPGRVYAALSDNTVHYYKFDSSNSNDSVGSKNGTDTGITYSSGNGIINIGAGFGGSSWIDYSSATMGFANAWTVSFWAKPSGFGGNPRIFFIPDSGVNGIVIGFNTAGKIFANWYSSTGVAIKEYTTTNAFSTGNWYNIVVTWDGTTGTVYVNASSQAVTGTDNSGTMTDTSRTLTLGSTDAHTATYSGAFDELGIWSRALSSAEVTSLYNAGAGVQYPFTVASTFVPWQFQDF